MENKTDPLKPNPNPLENRLFEGLKKPQTSSPTPYSYKLTDSNPNTPIPKMDMRPTENISAEELAKELEELKKKKADQQNKPFDPRATEKYEIPQDAHKKNPSVTKAGNPLAIERPTMDISVDQLKKALQEEINDSQVKQIMEKFQKGKAFLPFLQSKGSPSLPTGSDKGALEDGYLPTETISMEELQRVLQEKITPEEVQKILDLNKKTPNSLASGTAPPPPPPPPVYGSSFAPPPPPLPPTYGSSFVPPSPPSSTFKVSASAPASTFMPIPPTPPPLSTLKASSAGYGTAFMSVSPPLGSVPNSATIYSAKSPNSNVNTAGQTFLSQNSPTNKTFSSPTTSAPVSSKYDYSSEQQIEEVPANYRIYEFFLAKKPLGSGGTAHVFEAFIDGSRNQSAGIIKLARKGLGKLLMNEIDFAKQCISKDLAHDHLVKYLKTGVTPTGLPFVLSEKLTTFPHKELGFEDALAVISKIADVVYYLHKNHLYHRDLKPENILYAIEGKKIIPKIFDFGTVSKQINEHQTVAGTPFYAAPEVLKKIRGYSSEEVQFSRADVFSLAMTLLGLVKFNPYLELEPDLERKYQDRRLMVDRLIEFHETRYDEFLMAIEKFLRDKSYAAAITFRSGVKYAPHKDLVEALIPMIKSMLHLKPEDRPISTNIAKKMESLFSEKLGISLDQYLVYGCSLNSSEAK